MFSIFSHPAPLGHAIKKHVQSETQRSLSCNHKPSHFWMHDFEQLSSHWTCLSKGRSLHVYSQVPEGAVPNAFSA